MTRPTITVITPTHAGRMRNGMFGQAMLSVASQELLPDAISVAVDLDGVGACATRQRALDAAQTDWVAFLDSDDLFLAPHLKALMACAQDTGADFVYSWFKILADRGGRAIIMEDDPIFPITHYLNDWDPDDPIETTITTLVRTELAKEVGFQELDRGEANTGEDRFFTMGCLKAGANITHLVRKTWLWRHHDGNTSGHATKGDAV